MIIWLVVSTHLKNICQWEGLSHILWKIKNVSNHQPVTVSYPVTLETPPLLSSPAPVAHGGARFGASPWF